MYVKILHGSNWLARGQYQLTKTLRVNGWVIPSGYISDGFTLPRVVTLFFMGLLGLGVGVQSPGLTLLSGLLCTVCIITPLTGKPFKAAILHDYLLDSELVPRKQADNIFYETLVKMGIPKPIAFIYYCGVVFKTIFSK